MNGRKNEVIKMLKGYLPLITSAFGGMMGFVMVNIAVWRKKEERYSINIKIVHTAITIMVCLGLIGVVILGIINDMKH